ncbi:MAG: EAL domain-containing protein [Granulosicoccus sp.]
MADDSTIDPTTGLLHRAAFLQEVRNGKTNARPHLRRGCLLILHFPMLQAIGQQGGTEAATQALRNLLAVVETRLRSRDTLGRIAEHSLCVLLRQCREKDAVIIAEQYVALLRDVVIDTGGQIGPMKLRYRIVPLDHSGKRRRQGISRMVEEQVLQDATKLTVDNNELIPDPNDPTGKIVSISLARDRQKHPVQSEEKKPSASLTLAGESSSLVGQQGSAEQAVALRLKPGLLLSGKALVCCYRIQSVGAKQDLSDLQSNSMLLSAINALALDSGVDRPAVESQLILPILASQLNQELPAWLKKTCTTRRVAPSDVCFCVTVESLSKDLRATVPILRLLNRHGVRLMLDGVTSVSQFRALQNLAGFDYLSISARTLQSSWKQIRQRQELSDLVVEAKTRHGEICAAGVDSSTLLEHAKQMGIDIGFGRECGKSLPFPNLTTLTD